MEFASEMIMEAGAKDLHIEEVPIVYHEREGEETLESFRDGWRHVKFMLVNAPRYLFTVPGILLGLFGLLVMGVAYFGNPINDVTLGVHSLIAGSLFTILGMQVTSLGVFATVAGNPIRTPDDPVTSFITDRLTLERGATAGLLVFAAGAGYAGLLVADWIAGGFSDISFTASSLVSFTAIVIGVNVVFSSFFLSSVE